MVTATFDSNVWRKIVSPSRFPRDPASSVFQKLHDFILTSSLKGLLSETIFDLEAIPKKQRAVFFRSYQPKTTHVTVSSSGGSYHGRVKIGPDLESHPGNSDYHNQHLEDALALGFKLLRCPRIGMPKSPNTSPHMFLATTNEELGPVFERLGVALEFVSSLGAGIEQARSVANQFRTESDRVWYEAFWRAPEAEKHLVPKAIAEWADGDSIAAHIAHQVDYFCTLDQAIGAGSSSVFSPSNRIALTDKFGVVFVTPEELCKVLEDKLSKQNDKLE